MSGYSLNLVTGPTSEPVTLPQCKMATRIDSTSEDDYLGELIKAAREQVEIDTDLRLLPQTWLLTLDQFPASCDDDGIAIPMKPVTGVVVKYDDVNGTEQTLDASRYYLRSDCCPAKVYLKPGQAWPATVLQHGSVRVTVSAGFANAAAVPQRAKHAIYLLFGHWAEHRGLSTTKNYTDISFAYQSLTTGLRPGMV